MTARANARAFCIVSGICTGKLQYKLLLYAQRAFFSIEAHICRIQLNLGRIYGATIE